jgi:hypothetical protein
MRSGSPPRLLLLLRGEERSGMSVGTSDRLMELVGASTTAVPRPRCHGGWSDEDPADPDDPADPAAELAELDDEDDPDGSGPSPCFGSICVRSASLGRGVL